MGLNLSSGSLAVLSIITAINLGTLVWPCFPPRINHPRSLLWHSMHMNYYREHEGSEYYGEGLNPYRAAYKPHQPVWDIGVSQNGPPLGLYRLRVEKGSWVHTNSCTSDPCSMRIGIGFDLHEPTNPHQHGYNSTLIGSTRIIKQ